MKDSSQLETNYCIRTHEFCVIFINLFLNSFIYLFINLLVSRKWNGRQDQWLHRLLRHGIFPRHQSRYLFRRVGCCRFTNSWKMQNTNYMNDDVILPKEKKYAESTRKCAISWYFRLSLSVTWYRHVIKL